MIIKRLAIGTANFIKPYNGIVCRDVEEILDYCRDVGIDMLDTATTYGTEKIAPDFKKVIKITTQDNIDDIEKLNPYCIMVHHAYDYEKINRLFGVSVYDIKEYRPILGRVRNGHILMIQIPYNIYNRKWESLLPNIKKAGIEIHVRNVFLHGEVLKVLRPWQAVAFCLMNRYIDRVIIGIDSLEQLKQTVNPLLELESYETNDENIIDPRIWSKIND